VGTYLEIRNLSLNYGPTQALDELSLQIPRYSIAAFVGANGAGKTSSFSVIGGYIHPKKGEVLIEDVPIERYRARGGLLGLLPQDVQFFENRSVSRQLYLFARLSGLVPSAAKLEVERVLNAVELTSKADAKAGQLSRGMKMRFGVAQAIVGDPPLLLLDEPTAGLDPNMVVNFRRLILSLRGKATIVVSSHNLRELEDLCDYVCIIDKGRLVRQGRMEELLHENSKLRFRLNAPVKDLQALTEAVPNVEFNAPSELELMATFDTRRYPVPTVTRKVISWLFEHDIDIFSVDSHRSLEDRYLEEVSRGKKLKGV